MRLFPNPPVPPIPCGFPNRHAGSVGSAGRDRCLSGHPLAPLPAGSCRYQIDVDSPRRPSALWHARHLIDEADILIAAPADLAPPRGSGCLNAPVSTRRRGAPHFKSLLRDRPARLVLRASALNTVAQPPERRSNRAWRRPAMSKLAWIVTLAALATLTAAPGGRDRDSRPSRHLER